MAKAATKLPRYTVIIQWSPEDDAYVVSLPEWGPAAKTHGATYEEAARNAQEVLELLMEDGTGSSDLPDEKHFHFPGADVINLPDDPPSNQKVATKKARQSA